MTLSNNRTLDLSLSPSRFTGLLFRTEQALTLEPVDARSYGVDNLDLFRRAADYVDRIPRGTKPSDLPVQVPSQFEMAINLKTARVLDLAVPPTLLARADEVIE